MTRVLRGFLVTFALGTLCLGCSKPATDAPDPAAKKVANAKPNVADKAAKSSAKAAEPPDPNAKLTSAYHAVRCMLSGSVRPDDGVYKAHGFEDAAAFSIAFSAAATEDPQWATSAIEKSLKKPCENK